MGKQGAVKEPCCKLVPWTVAGGILQVVVCGAALVAQWQFAVTGGTVDLWGSYVFWENALDVCLAGLVCGCITTVFSVRLLSLGQRYICAPRSEAKALAKSAGSQALWLAGLSFTTCVFALTKVMFAAVHDTRDPAFWAAGAVVTLSAGGCALLFDAALAQTLSLARKRRVGEIKAAGAEQQRAVSTSFPPDTLGVQLSPAGAGAGLGAKTPLVPDHEEGEEEEEEEEEEDRPSTGVNISRLLALAAADGWFLLLGFGGLCVAAAAQTALPLWTGKVVDAIAINKDYEAFHRGVTVLVCVALAAGVFAGVRGSMMTIAFSRLKVRLRQRLFDSLVEQDMAYYDTVRTGELVSRMAADVTKVGDSISLQLNIFLRCTIQALGTLGFMLSLSWQLTIVVLMLVPPITLLTRVYGDFIRKIYKRIQKAVAVANAVAQETLGAIATVKSLGAEGMAQQHHAGKLGTFLHLSVLQAGAYFLYIGLYTFLPSAITAALLFAGGWLIFHGHVSPGVLISFLLYQVTLTDALSSIASVFAGLMQAVGAADKIFRIMDRAPTVKERGTLVRPRGEVRGEVAFKDVHFAYPTRPGAPVLRGFNLTIPAGRSVALVGGSGNGKSSVIRLLQRFYDPQAGSITLDGRPLGAYDVTWRRRVVSLVQQEPTLLARSVRDNIVLGLESESLRWGDELEDEGDAPSDEEEGAAQDEIETIWGVGGDSSDEEGGGSSAGHAAPLLSHAAPTGMPALTPKQRAEQRAVRRAIRRRRVKEAAGTVKTFAAPAWATEAAFLADMSGREAAVTEHRRLFREAPASPLPGPVGATASGDAWHAEATAALADIYDANGRVKQEAIEAAARLADAHAFVTALPHGYDTLCGERGTSMSGGQKQRIALARAILRNPVVLALDEATSALDAASEHAVQRAIDNLMADRSRTVLVVAHRLSTVRSCDVIAVVQEGRVVEAGGHEELLAARGHYFALVQRQLDGGGDATED